MDDHTERTATEDFDGLLLDYFKGPSGGRKHKPPAADTAITPAESGVELLVHKEVRPRFLLSAPAGAYSRQIDIIVPVTNASDSLPKAAEKGSAVLLEFKREEERAKAARDKVDLTKSDLHVLAGGSVVGQKPLTDPYGDADDDHMAVKRSRESVGGVSEDGADRRELDALRQKVKEMERGTRNTASLEEGERKTPHASQTALRVERRAALTAAEDLRRQKANAHEHGDSSSSERESWFLHRDRILSVRQSLPIFHCRAELLRYIGENSVSIIMGETGSGKTTQLVQYLYEAGYASTNNKIIGCTQPRRLAAIGVATRVADEVGCVLGTTVGYSIHLDDKTTEQTKIRFMTDGVLLREVVSDPDLEKYSVIVMDEAHERSMDTDVLLGVLKAVCRRRTDLKVIVTSATMNIMKFSSFFGNAPYYEIPGKTFDVDVRYASSPVDDYVHEAVLKTIEIHVRETLDAEARHQAAVDESGSSSSHQRADAPPPPLLNTNGDILVFMTGRDDVYGACALLKHRLKSMARRRNGDSWDQTLLIIPCMSEAVQNSSGAAATALFDPAPPGMRKCIVSTNVAETSLTIDGIRFVVDCGMMKTNVFHPTFGMNTLKRYPTSQAQANQRKGRAGRTREGTCFRLYTKEQFAREMLPATVPEIQRSSVDTVVLLLKSIGVRDLSAFDFIDQPPEANVRNSLWQLWLFGALDDAGDITESGRCMLEFPVNPTLANVLIHSTRLKCSMEMLSIVAMLTADVTSLFELPAGREEDARQAHGRFANGESDHLTYLNVFTQYTSAPAQRQWAKDHFLNATILDRAVRVREQLTEKIQRLRLPIVSAGDEGMDVVRRCLVHGYSLQAARKVAGKWSEYQSLLNVGVTCHVVPSSSILSAGSVPEYIIYDDLLLTTKEYFVTVSAVDPSWLVSVGRGLYSVKGGAGVESHSNHGEDWVVTLDRSALGPNRTSRVDKTAAIPSFAERGKLASSMFDDLLTGAAVVAAEVPKAEPHSGAVIAPDDGTASFGQGREVPTGSRPAVLGNNAVAPAAPRRPMPPPMRRRPGL